MPKRFATASRPEPQVPSADELKTAMAHYFLQGGEQEPAAFVLGVPFEVSYTAFGIPYVHITFVGPREVYDRMTNSFDALHTKICLGLRAVAPTFGFRGGNVDGRLELPALTSDDQRALTDLALGRNVHNQAPGIPREHVVLWNNLRFRSVTEAKIAEALDRAAAAFWPNCRSRVGSGKHRRNIEADFLVLQDGRFGVLEIDGEPWHPPERRAEEQQRDRLWNRHGVKVVQHYDAKRAYAQPDGVVADFLGILARVAA